MTTCISNTDDIIDSRDVIARIEELTERKDDESNPLDEEETAELAARELQMDYTSIEFDGVTYWVR